MNKNKMIVLKILELKKEMDISELDLIGGLFSAIRNLSRDDDKSSEVLKKLFCEFVDKTIGFRGKFDMDLD